MARRGSTRSGPDAVVVGASAGGLQAIRGLLGELPQGFTPPVIIVQHIHASQDDFVVDWLDQHCALPVREAGDKVPVAAGTVWMAPAGYHLLIERERTFALNIDPRVSWARPSIDVLFEGAARVWRDALVAVLLTGANADGTAGLRTVRALGGRAIVQDPTTAEHPLMPRSAIEAGVADEILTIPEIGARLRGLAA